MGWWLEWSGTSLILACAKPYSQKETKPFEKLKESWNARCSENCSERYYRICEHQFTVNIIDTPLESKQVKKKDVSLDIRGKEEKVIKDEDQDFGLWN